MKKYITYAVVLLCAALTASCSKEGSVDAAGGTGVLEMKISTTRTDAAGEYDPMDHLAVRIYQTRSGQEVLLRQYTAATRPERLELLAGTYRVAVEAGEIEPASFTKRFYKGEKTFTVTAGETTPVEIECKRQNVVAQVKFDATVPAAFGENFHAWVAAAETFDEAQAESVPALRYTADGTGYFTMPEGVTTLSTSFRGTHPERGEITYADKFENVLPGGKYTVTFRFSKDLPGFIECFILKVDTSTDDQDDTIPFSPEPTIEGDGFMLSQPHDFIPGSTLSRSYKISAMNALADVKVTIGATTYDALTETTPGIEVVNDGDLSLTLTLSEALFEGLPGGSHPVSIHVADISEAQTTGVSEYRIQGLLPVEPSDYDLWTNRITLRAMVVDPAITSVTFGLRTAEGTWVDLAGTAAGNGIYSATFDAQWTESQNAAGLKVYTPEPGTGVFAGTSYEARAALDGSATYDTDFTTAAGDTIYNAGMEDWTTYNVVGSTFTGGTVPYPNANSNTVFWVGGNNKNTDALCTGVTEEGNNGEKCALLCPGVATGNNFAAGNLFTGTFECGTGFLDMFGYARFGVKYTYTARPKALRIHYKATIDKVTLPGKTGLTTDDYDYAKILVCITDWSARHSVQSGVSFDEKTFWSPDEKSRLEEGDILGYSSRLIMKSTEGWVTETFPIVWYAPEAGAPAGNFTLVISCATSYKGDYMGGSQNNRLYVEDFEWVY